MFGAMSAWLDELAPDRGAYAHARAWSERFGCPLHAFATPAPDSARKLAPLLAADCLPGREHLCVFGQRLPKAFRAELLRRSALQGTSLLICPDEWRALSRLLLLHDDSDHTFIRTAVKLCATLGVHPIVLTLARSENAALRRARSLQDALAEEKLDCEFDQFAGLDAERAVVRVASWRRCQVVVLKRRAAPSWWPWRREMLERLTAEISPLAFLALPETGRAEPVDAAASIRETAAARKLFQHPAGPVGSLLDEPEI